MPLIALMLHRVLPEAVNNYYFRRGMAISHGKFELLLDQVEKCRRPVVIPRPGEHSDGVCFTFDDGYADIHWALEKLYERRWPSIVFPVRDYICNQFSATDDLAAFIDATTNGVLSDTERQKMERLRTIIRRMSESRYRHWRKLLANISFDSCSKELFLSEADLAYWALHGVELGIHGVSHRIWSSLMPKQLYTEIKLSEDWIQSIGGKPPGCVAFPHGKEPSSVLSDEIFYGKLFFGVDRQYNNASIVRRSWVRETSSVQGILGS